MPSSSLAPRLGRYTLLRSLGAGGMAELFLARADGIEGFAKLVALKRILPHKASNERFVRMLLNEARLVAGLDHPNIAQVHDIGLEHGEYFFAMEYVHGQDLAHVLARAPGHRLHLENALHIAIGLCAGLHCAHIARDGTGRPLDIVHRDVSPSNVLVSYQGAVKLVDFGVAKAATLVSETREGVIKGKYGYMSPEQCLGDPLDRRSDVFAVGILLWEMTVGRRLYAFKGELASLQRIVYVDAPRPSRFDPQYPEQLEHIVMRALARDPRQRYQSAEQLQLDLEQFALDHRLAVSAVSMAIEMKSLFRDQIEAWTAAERAGKSLGDHLATASPPPPIDLDDFQPADSDLPDPFGAAIAADQARATAANAFDAETRPDVRPAPDDIDTRATTPRGTAKIPLHVLTDPARPAEPARPARPAPPASAAAPAPPAPIAPPITPQELSRQLRRSQESVKIRPSRGVPAIFVVFLVIAIAAAWLVLFQSP
ncbi:MAG TPA: serine/threonine-protein kinase [Kofleriaceae bacterium]|nr:serine/threonine-protein kinase [Kofleriaceae bacterium]